jgi:WD40 repeat protein
MLATLLLATTIMQAGDGPRVAVFSPDGKAIAEGGDRAVVFSGKSLPCLGTVTGVAFVSDDALVAVSQIIPDPREVSKALREGREPPPFLAEVIAYHLPSRRQLWQRNVEQRTICMALHGKTLATSCNRTGNGVQLWNVETGKELHTFEGDRPQFGADVIRSLSFNHDGTVLASGGDDGVRVWDVPGRRHLMFLTARQPAVAFCGDVLGVADSEGLSFRNVRPWEKLYESKKNYAWLLAAVPGKSVFATVVGGTGARGVRFLDATSGRELAAMIGVAGEEQSILSIAFSPDGRRMAVVIAETTKDSRFAPPSSVKILDVPKLP